MASREERIEMMMRAMATSQAQDDEGTLPTLFDHLDYSGENKRWTVLRAAAAAALDAIENDVYGEGFDEGYVHAVDRHHESWH